MYLEKGELLTSRKACYSFLKTDTMRDIEWFRGRNYPEALESYGSFIGTYKASKRLFLINLGCSEDRQMVLEHTCLTKDDLDPDIQYSGYEANLKVHRAILNTPSLQWYDGTFVSEDHSDPDLRTSLEGAEEVVIFTARANLTLTDVRKDDEPG